MKDKQGFTLLELLIVIGIIAVLGGVMLAQFSSSTDSALAATCMNNMRTLCNAVMADGSKESYYPSAGPYEYLTEDLQGKPWFQGWQGHKKGDTMVSCYHDGSSNGEDQHYAITNGTIWRAMGGQQGAYVCPAHTKYCKQNKKGVVPSWSYVMNSYFGWNYNDKPAPDIEMGRRSFGSGSFDFRYSSEPTTRSRSKERVLLFAEIPYVENGVQHPDWSASPGDENDMILQYPPSSEDNDKSKRANKPATGKSEIIGFNHKSGKYYSAHVAFADGHCAKLVLPEGASEDNLKELTTWLCTGVEYTFNGSKYEKVDE